MKLSLFDTHCDTAYEVFKRKEGLQKNSLHVSLDYASEYGEYCQCTAIWSDRHLDDALAYNRFFEIFEYFKRECDSAGTVLCRTYDEIEKALEQGKRAFVLTVEDARLLAGDISRLDSLRDCGVKMLTFQWQGETCIGGGFDTDMPLKPFGELLAHKCAEYGIIPDISHACERTARGIIEIMQEHGKAVIATHSNSYSVCPHKRNMTDRLFDALLECKGIVGISLAPQHLSIDSKADCDTVLAHIEHYAERGGIGSVCLGCDFDGIETTPTDITDMRYLYNLADKMLSHNYSDDQVKKVFYINAQSFLKANLI